MNSSDLTWVLDDPQIGKQHNLATHVVLKNYHDTCFGDLKSLKLKSLFLIINFSSEIHGDTCLT